MEASIYGIGVKERNHRYQVMQYKQVRYGIKDRVVIIDDELIMIRI